MLLGNRINEATVGVHELGPRLLSIVHDSPELHDRQATRHGPLGFRRLPVNLAVLRILMVCHQRIASSNHLSELANTIGEAAFFLSREQLRIFILFGGCFNLAAPAVEAFWSYHSLVWAFACRYKCVFIQRKQIFKLSVCGDACRFRGGICQ